MAPEDIKQGDYVTRHNETLELICFNDCFGKPSIEVLTAKIQAFRAGIPLKVKAICLPFVTVKAPSGRSEVIDLRATQLVRLDPTYAKTTYKALKDN